jgi:hypothetical protein
MHRFWRSIFFFALGVPWLVVSAGAQRASQMSSSRHFAVRGLPAADASGIARWCDEVEGHVNEWVEQPVPFQPGEWIEVFCDEVPAEPARVVKGQGHVEGRLQQRLSVVNVSDVDQEDMLEGLVWLLLNRFVIHEQTPQQRDDHLGAVPDWLAVGVAQCLYPELRQRNTRLVTDRWVEGATADLPELLSVEFLPPGRWIEKAQAGLAVEWMTRGMDASNGMTPLWQELARTSRVDMKWLAEEWMGLLSKREMYKAWDLWLASQQRVVTASEEELSRFKRLRAMMVVRPEDYAVAGPGVPASMTMAHMIKMRAQPWMPSLAERLNMNIQSVSLGQGGDLQVVTAAYGRFLDALKRAGGKGRGLLGSRTDASSLAKMLSEADRLLVQVETSWSDRTRYLDDVASGLATAPGESAGASAPWESLGDESLDRIRSYLDQMEGRQPARP